MDGWKGETAELKSKCRNPNERETPAAFPARPTHKGNSFLSKTSHTLLVDDLTDVTERDHLI